jgi:hypothetical protein
MYTEEPLEVIAELAFIESNHNKLVQMHGKEKYLGFMNKAVVMYGYDKKLLVRNMMGVYPEELFIVMNMREYEELKRHSFKSHKSTDEKDILSDKIMNPVKEYPVSGQISSRETPERPY